MTRPELALGAATVAAAAVTTGALRNVALASLAMQLAAQLASVLLRWRTRHWQHQLALEEALARRDQARRDLYAAQAELELE